MSTEIENVKICLLFFLNMSFKRIYLFVHLKCDLFIYFFINTLIIYLFILFLNCTLNPYLLVATG